MFKTFIIVIFVLIGFGSFAQIELQWEVVSAGGKADISDIQLTHTLGDTFVFQAEGNNLIISGGFQQGPILIEDVGCLGDSNDDGLINTMDLLNLLEWFGCTIDCEFDFNGDGFTNTMDLLAFLALFNSECSE